MKKNAFALVAAVLVAGCILPEGVTEEDLLSFDAAVASIGCDLADESDYLPVELQTGMPREKLVTIAQYKVEQEEAVTLSNGGVRIKTGACAPTPAPAAAAT
ncbi:hypothetical protein [Antarctobacter heliothermus]|uniref:NADH dehydrogenase n=1 Tax=Antarctobacter heliothermus TaxID=74033 RepID=A0A239D4P8_9RHOB|nr:hypothetical protein [Antarctobacter heliothermus]SNS27112.1 hypothetical protein SAMN04488078_100969 [Antarctobacter heliothermus]